MPEPAPSSVKSKKRPLDTDSTAMEAMAGLTSSTSPERDSSEFRSAVDGRPVLAGEAICGLGRSGAGAVSGSAADDTVAEGGEVGESTTGAGSDEHAIKTTKRTEAPKMVARVLPRRRCRHNPKPDTRETSPNKSEPVDLPLLGRERGVARGNEGSE